MTSTPTLKYPGTLKTILPALAAAPPPPALALHTRDGTIVSDRAGNGINTRV